MLRTAPQTRMKTSTMWYILSAIFFTIGIVSALGEWVFHWWQDPGQWTALLGLALGAFALVWGASADDVADVKQELRALRADQAAQLGELRDGQREQTSLLRENSSLLREVVASFRRE